MQKSLNAYSPLLEVFGKIQHHSRSQNTSKSEESENNELAHETESILAPKKPKSNNWWMKIFCATILLLYIIGLGMIFALVKQDSHLYSYENYSVFPERKAFFLYFPVPLPIVLLRAHIVKSGI